MWRYWQPWVKDAFFYWLPQGRRYKRLIESLHDFSKKVVAYKREERKNYAAMHGSNYTSSKGRHLSFMDLILDVNENQQALDDEDIQDLVDTFTFAVKYIFLNISSII